MLALQREAQRLAVARGDHRVMLATPAGELHVVALRMVDNLLREAGYDVVMLGPDVPAADLAAAAAATEPRRGLPERDDARRDRPRAGRDRRGQQALAGSAAS